MDTSARERSVVLFGAGGHAKVVLDTCQAAGLVPVACLGRSDAPTLLGVEVQPEAAAAEWLRRGVDQAVVAIGDNRVRERVALAALAQGFRLVTVVHPTACIARSAVLGAGTVVFAGAVVQPDVVIGDAVIVNTGASVDHDCRLGRAVHVAPHATVCGTVVVGDRTWIGAGSTVIERMRIAEDVFVAAGAAVVTDVLEAGTRVGGVPARRLGTR